ncbi:hypothetical protein HOLleu_23305 [Holothuria leucospilota]|uniref:Uncharacterized protein n=1 Tax=Holothuria leucospilota TaxID=206669 RepID=A0A9Q1BV47_HOLLE|nr:hypothetical protein HOLleu_23305 [Holothuria leucospilota]
MEEREAFITIKDYKDNFPNKVSCKFINLAKSEMGRVSKIILDRVEESLMTTLVPSRINSLVLLWSLIL